VHPIHRTSVAAILLQCALVLGLAITSTFERLAILANLATLVMYAMCCLATWQLRRRDVRGGGIPFKVPAPTLVVVLACLVIGWILTSVTLAEWGAFALAGVLATALFALRRRPGAGATAADAGSPVA
ncbi:MAG: hypothetical protein H0W53_02210, partial [Acidobacteria bacterium]|nr:hypothetical protein [Acidobacteriota bacterium]